MSGAALNLSRRPFVNSRPVTRVALLLWLVGGILLLGNVFLFWSYLSSSSAKRAELASAEKDVERQQRAVSQLEGRLASLDLEQQNEQVAFLNRKIAERTFSWSLLFDRLAEVLPADVRLIQLQPSAIAGDDRKGSRPAVTVRGRRPPGSSDRVPLLIQGETRDDEALLQLIDRMFAHPSFDDPDLAQEMRNDEGDRLRFDLRVVYLPAGRAPQSPQSPQSPVIIEEAPPPPPVAVPPAAKDSEIE